MIYAMPGILISVLLTYGAPDYLLQHPGWFLTGAVVGLLLVVLQRTANRLQLSVWRPFRPGFSLANDEIHLALHKNINQYRANAV